MLRFASIALIAAANLRAIESRQMGQPEMAAEILRYIQPQRMVPRGKKRHSDGRPTKRRNMRTVSKRVRRKHRRAA